MTTGYSGKPLGAKLGLKPGWAVAVVDPPMNYWDLVQPLPEGLTVRPVASGNLNCIHLFVTSYAALLDQLPDLKTRIVPNGMLWVSWPKRSASVPTDVTEDRIRDLALSHGLVDVKVCAVDATWSGLKLVIPRKDRSGT